MKNSPIPPIAFCATIAVAGPASADAIISYERPPPTFGKARTEVALIHGRAMRIDGKRVDNPSQLSQQFTRPGQPARFEISRDVFGIVRHLSLTMDKLDAPPVEAARSFTGARRSMLDETCREWKVTTAIRPGFDFVQSGCITADGIELQRKQANIDSIFATKVDRRPVPIADVTPPLGLLDPKTWVSDAQSVSHKGDYEVAFEAGDQRTTIRRSGDWTAKERRSKNPEFTLRNARQGFQYRYLETSNGPALYIDHPVPSDRAVRMSNRPSKMLFGETCQWWDAAPNVADVTEHECRTDDGALLEVESGWRVSASSALYFKRGHQPASAVAPPSIAISPKTWGF